VGGVISRHKAASFTGLTLRAALCMLRASKLHARTQMLFAKCCMPSCTSRAALLHSPAAVLHSPAVVLHSSAASACATRGIEVLNATSSAAAPSGQRDPTWTEASPMACLGSHIGTAAMLHLSRMPMLMLTFLAWTRIPSLLLTFVASIRTSAFLILGAVRHAVAKLEAFVRVGGTPAYRAFLSDRAFPCKRLQQPSHPLLLWPMTSASQFVELA
jgi:hypothetical protein